MWTMHARVGNSAATKALYRGKSPTDPFMVKAEGLEGGTGPPCEYDIRVLAFHRDGNPPEMQISSADPTSPWRRDNAGFPCTLQGNEVSNLMSSALWQRQVTEDSAKRQCLHFVAKRTKYDGEGALPEVMLSVEVYMSLLCRFHAAETLVLGTWDPCAVVQAAAVQLSVNSIVFLGMKTKTTLQGLGLAQTPLLGVTNPGPGELVRVVADSSGKVASSAKDGSSGGVMKPHVAQVAAK
ncbi:unnamed protein product, partial [Laminaria digitata]